MARSFHGSLRVLVTCVVLLRLCETPVRSQGRPRIATPAIRKVSFTQNSVTGDTNAHVHFARLDAELVEQIKQTKNLGTVFLGRMADDSQLAMLVDVPLKGLVVRSEGVTDSGIEAFKDHSTLQSLGLWKSSITDRSLVTIGEMRALTKLTVQHADISDDALDELIGQLAENGVIKSLNLFRCATITDSGLRRIGQLESLERLFLNNNDGLTSSILKDIASLEKLQRLEIDRISLEQDDLRHLVALKQLETFSMTSSPEAKLSDAGLVRIAGVPTLTSLTIQESAISSAGITELVKLKKLERLGLARTTVKDDDLGVIAAGLPHLTRLGLSGTKVTDGGMVHVGKLTKLEGLSLDATSVGDNGVRQLDGLKSLETLWLNRDTVSGNAEAEFKGAHPETRVFLKAE